MYPTNLVNLAQAKELSLKREGFLAQATNSRVGESTNKGHVEVSLRRDYSRSGEWPSLR